MDLEALRQAVRTANVIRQTTRLMPMSAGGLTYPPTYLGPNDKAMHIFRSAWIDGEQHQVVVLDSPQSQSNRIEEAIKEAITRGDLIYPDIVVKVERSDGVTETYSVLDLSHRVFDAVLQATTIDGVAFPESDIGQAVHNSRQSDAAGLFIHAPITLVLGGWDSHTGGGPLAAKIQRMITSEVIGVDAEVAERGATKFDPMDIRKAAGPIYKSTEGRHFELTKGGNTDSKKKNPSDLGFGSVPAYETRGASINYALQSTMLSLAAVRRLSFPDADGSRSSERDLAGQVATVALGLHGIALQRETGYSLRSGCDLLAESESQAEVMRTLSDTELFTLGTATTKALLDAALAAAADESLRWREEVVTAIADERLVALVDRSRATAETEG